jgi:hypothetical protein
MNRSHFLLAAALLAAPAIAHHGWSSFDQDKPLYLSGVVKQVRWQNPHAEVVLQVDAKSLPDGLAARKLPAQQQSVDGAALLKRTQVPANAVGDWEIEFAPLSRMQAWGLGQAPKPGERMELVGYTLADGSKRLLRVEYLFYNGKAYAFRSSPTN